MATTKKATNKTATRSKTTSAKVSRPKKVTKKEALDLVPDDTNPEINESSKRSFLNRRFFIFLLIIGLLVLAYNKKSLFVAATVNGQPVSNLALLQRMDQLYRAKTLSQLTNEAIIDQEAQKKGIKITEAQIDQKLNENIDQQYGGQQNLDMIIEQQGENKQNVMTQLRLNARLQLLLETLYASEIKPTDEEIQKYMDDNASTPEATEPAKLKATAQIAVKQDKLSKVFAEKFQELKNSAKIKIF